MRHTPWTFARRLDFPTTPSAPALRDVAVADVILVLYRVQYYSHGTLKYMLALSLLFTLQSRRTHSRSNPRRKETVDGGRRSAV